jgi:membrane protease YdiL (CAAX protease family)
VDKALDARRWPTGCRYDASSPWSVPAALAAAVAILAIGVLGGGFIGRIVELMLAMSGAGPYTGRAPPVSVSSIGLLIRLGLMQLIVIVLVMFAAGISGGRPRTVLALRGAPAPTELLPALGAMILLIAPYNLAVHLISPDSVVQDLQPFAGFMRSDLALLAAVVIGIGAPMSEEMLFRGFLQSALAQSRIGYFGASLVTTMGWTALHAGYTAAGLVEVFLIGLLLSWLLWRTGNLWVTIVCHAAYNLTLLAILAAIELPV